MREGLLPLDGARSDGAEHVRRRMPSARDEHDRAVSPRMARVYDDLHARGAIEDWRRKRNRLEAYLAGESVAAAQKRAPAPGARTARTPKARHADLILVFSSQPAVERIVVSLRSAGLRARALRASDGARHFLVITASSARLEEQAERSKLDKRLKPEGAIDHCYMDYTASSRDLFARGSDGSLFTSLERQQLVLEIVEGDARSHGAGLDLDRLKAERAIDDYVFLPSEATQRWLRTHWLGWQGHVTLPPVDELRDYAGLQAAFVFAWQATYTRAVGVLALISVPFIALAARTGSVDNGAWTPAYCALLGLWCTGFGEVWKRQNAVLAHRWNCDNALIEAPTRPEYLAGSASLPRRRGHWSARGFVADDDAPELLAVLPRWRGALSALLSTQGTTLFIGALVAAVLAINGLKLALRAYRAGDIWGEHAATVAAALNTGFIALMNVVWGRVSVWLTDAELHRTDAAYENALVLKTFAFRFVNSYSALFYLAFAAGWRVSLYGLRGPDGRRLRDSCPPPASDPSGAPDCMAALHTQMEMVVVALQLVRQLAAVLPLALGWLREQLCGARRAAVPAAGDGEAALRARIEAELALPENPGTFSEMSEMTIQYGYMCLFAAAYPLGALVCFLNNLLELRLDGAKLLLLCRRPRGEYAVGIGAWEPILNFLSVLAVLTNCALLLLASQTARELHLDAAHSLRLVLCLEHALLALKWLLAELIPDEPFWVVAERAKLRWKLRELELADGGANGGGGIGGSADVDDGAADDLAHAHAAERGEAALDAAAAPPAADAAAAASRVDDPDLVLALPTAAEDAARPAEERRALAAARASMLARLRRAGVEVRAAQSADGARALFLLYASQARFEAEAEATRLDKRVKLPPGADPHRSVGYKEWRARDKEALYEHGPDEYFTALERQQLAFSIVEGDVRAGGAQLDLDDLVVRGVLHTYVSLPVESYVDALRGSWLRSLAAAPLDGVRDYLGESVALYFAWVDTYTTWLGALAALSLGMAAYTAAVGAVDNPLVVPYCLALALWSAAFLRAWARHNAALNFRWNSDDSDELEPVRPEFIALPGLEQRRGLYTARGFVALDDPRAPVVPFLERRAQRGVRAATLAVTLALTAFVAAGVLAIFGLKLLLAASRRGDIWGEHAETVAAALNTAFITLMNFVWARVSVWLTDAEQHRTDAAYENALVLKTFAFQFVNSFYALFYLAFAAGSRVNLYGLRGPDGEQLRDSCPPFSFGGGTEAEPDCMLALYNQLQMITLLRQGVRHVQALLPLLRGYLVERCAGVDVRQRRYAPLLVRIDAELQRPVFPGLFTEYLEMALQFGYVACFGAAYPLGAVLCCLNNLLERRTDAVKVLLICQRPRALRASSIGAWRKILELIALLAVFTNVGILLFASQSLYAYGVPRAGSAKLLVCVALEHALLCFRWALAELVADEPFWVNAARTKYEHAVRVRFQHHEEPQIARVSADHVDGDDGDAGEADDDSGSDGGDDDRGEYASRTVPSIRADASDV